ncbi:hypothetical protein H2198_005469 [Neophaeococcomyces mojaviensis]|uniref:Uncharacterized protein n=1 Tax=Neophaeococcomyces mojaviensis TaxID=3383035 RepID=A0ACC3A5M3_9EURO|nr:hypothetical protein H2198_005469 [Knufia sp. JES_112]
MSNSNTCGSTPNHDHNSKSSPPSFITKPTKKLIPASHGYAAALKAGTSFRLIDLYGQQVIDMSAFVLPFPDNQIASAEHFSPQYTLFSTKGQPISVGETLRSNMNRSVLKLTHDTVKTHDMTFMSCFPGLYEDLGFKPSEHRSCAENMVEAFGPWGMKYLSQVKGPFNVFQNTPNWSLKPLGTSRAGDWCQFEVMVDCVVGWSCCPFDVEGFNGGKVTDVMVLLGLDKDENRSSEALMEQCDDSRGVPSEGCRHETGQVDEGDEEKKRLGPGSGRSEKMLGMFSASSDQQQLSFRSENQVELCARCVSTKGYHFVSRIDLNDCLINNWGSLEWAKGGNFAASARNIELVDGGKRLQASLGDGMGGFHDCTITLDERITNEDGRLVFLEDRGTLEL